MRREQPGDAAEDGGRGLGPGDDEQVRVLGQPVRTKIALVLLLDEGLDEVVALDAEVDAVVELVAHELHVLVVLHQAGPVQLQDDGLQAQVVHGADKGALADGLGDDLDPGVVGGVAQGAEGGAEAEVADDVEGRPVVPVLHVQRHLAILAVLVQLPDQQVRVLVDEGRLRAHRLLREAGRELAPQDAVLLAVRGEHRSGAVIDRDVEACRFNRLIKGIGRYARNSLGSVVTL